MSLAYTPPGVSVEEVITNSISPLLASPALVCLVGLTQGYQTRTDQVVLSGTSPVTLSGLPVGATINSVLAVRDALNPSKGASDGSGYTLTTDYTVQTSGGTLTRVSNGAISDGTLVNVIYTYTVANYYAPIRLYDLGSVESRFGSGLDSTGSQINSPVSYAASLAFENGAGSVVIQPLFKRATPGDPTSAAEQPNATQAASLTTWQDTLYVLRDIEDINVIVPIVGQSQPNVGDASMLSIFQAVQDHEYFMANQDQYIIGLFAEDSSASTTVATQAIVRNHANTLRGRYGGVLAEQNALLNTTRFTRSLPGYGRSISIGGQYTAAAISGMLASSSVSTSQTRKVVSGITSVTDSRSLQEKNDDAAAGLMVIESKNGNVLIRHSITLDQTGPARRELSVVRAKHRMIESVRDTIDRQIIGQIIADANAPSIVSATVTSVLEQLRLNRDLVDYSAVESRILSIDPTTIQVRFSYRPAIPLNYVNIQFSLDLSNQTVSTDNNTLTGV